MAIPLFIKRGYEVWRDYVTNGVPSSGKYRPLKPDIRTWSAAVEFGATRVQIVKAVSTVDVNIAALGPGSSVDGVVVAEDDVVGLAGQSAPAQNGLYQINAAAPATRYVAFSTYDDHPSLMMVAEQGDDNASAFFICNSAAGGTLGVTAINFVVRTQGPAGARGVGIDHDASGALADRDDYDDEAKDFVFLQTDVLPFIIWIKASASSGDWDGPSEIGDISILAMGVTGGRLSVLTGEPNPVSEIAGANVLYYVPDVSPRLGLYNSILSKWEVISFTQPSIKTIDVQSGSIINGQPEITGLSDTSQFIEGMKILAGVGIPASAVVLSVDSASQVTMGVSGSPANATVTATQLVTFKLPADSNFDVFAFKSASAVKMKFAAWSNNTTPSARGAQDGILTRSGAAGDRLLGSIRTTSIDGEVDWTLLRRFVSNLYNARPVPMVVTDQTDNWTYGSSSWRIVRAQTFNRVSFVSCVGRSLKACAVAFGQSASGGRALGVGIGIDSLVQDSSTLKSPAMTPAANVFVSASALFSGNPGVGYHEVNWLEYGNAADAIIFAGDAGAAGLADITQSGMVAEVDA